MTRTARSRALFVSLFFCAVVWVSNLAAADVRLRESGGFDLNADFHRVKDLAVDGSGNIYVLGLVRGGDGKVVVYGPSGSMKASFGEDHLYSSTHLALLRSGGVVVYDLVSRDSENPGHYVDGGLRVFNVKGEFVKTIPLPADHQKVAALAEGADGKIWTVYNQSNDDGTRILLKVDKIDSGEGSIIATYTVATYPNPHIVAVNTGFVPDMYAPTEHLVVASDGSVVVGRSQEFKVFILDQDGRVKAQIVAPRSRNKLLPTSEVQEQQQMAKESAKKGSPFVPERFKSSFAGLALDDAGRLVIAGWETTPDGSCLSDVYDLTGKRVASLTSPLPLSQAVKFSGGKAFDLASDKNLGYQIVTYGVR